MLFSPHPCALTLSENRQQLCYCLVRTPLVLIVLEGHLVIVFFMRTIVVEISNKMIIHETDSFILKYQLPLSNNFHKAFLKW